MSLGTCWERQSSIFRTEEFSLVCFVSTTVLYHTNSSRNGAIGVFFRGRLSIVVDVAWFGGVGQYAEAAKSCSWKHHEGIGNSNSARLTLVQRWMKPKLGERALMPPRMTARLEETRGGDRNERPWFHLNNEPSDNTHSHQCAPFFGSSAIARTQLIHAYCRVFLA